MPAESGRAAERPVRNRLAVAAGAGAIAVYAAILGAHASRAAGGSDSSGYLNEARSLARGTVTDPVPLIDRLGLDDRFAPAFIPLGFVPSARPREMTFYYPPGLPLHMAAAATVAGWDRGPFWVAPLCAAAAVWLLFVFGRDVGLSAPQAAAGSAILAVHPAFLFEALQPMSDVPATAWSLAVLLCARRSRMDARWAAGAGAAFGIAFLIRPASILLLLPALVFLGTDRRRLAGFVAGGIAPFLVFVGFNLAAFGRPFLTGYARGGLLDALAWENFPARVRHYAHWLSATLTGLVLLGWLVSLPDRRILRRDRAAFLLWFSAFFLFYCFYGPYETWWYLRFLLPAFPALILAFALALRHAVDAAATRVPRRIAGATAALAVAVVLALEIRQVRRLRVRAIVADESTYPDVARWAAAEMPPDALVVAMQMSGALRYYTGFAAARWDGIPDALWPPLLAAAAREGYRPYALLFPFEENEVVRRIPGPWTPIAVRHGVSLWRLGGAADRAAAGRP